MPETLQMLWWKWWSNPITNLHADHHSRIPYNLNRPTDKPMEHFQLLQIRNILELDELPGPTLETQHELVALAVAPIESVENHLAKLCVLTLDNMIIHARPQEWESKFGITSADAIRQTIEDYRSIPAQLSKWQFATATIINHNESLVISAKTRAIIGLGILLKSFFPQFYKRWVLTTDQKTTKLLDKVDPIDENAWPEIVEWMGGGLTALYNEVAAQYQEPDLPLGHDLLEDIYTPLDVDSIYGGSHA